MVDQWNKTAPTAIEAAYILYLALANNQPADWHPSHKPAEGKTDPTCDYNTVYDSEHLDSHPCKSK